MPWTKEKPIFYLIPTILLILVSIFFRLHQLPNIPGINGDEAFTSVQMKELVQGKPVTLWVPTQRILSPVYSTWVLLVQTFSPPSNLTIRLPAAIAGVLLVFLVYYLLKDNLGHSIALLSSLFVAVSPMAIAYSRSAVEQCLMGVVGIFCIFFSLEGKLKSTLIAFSIALLSHPVNVFLAPILFFPLAVRFSSKRMLPYFGALILVLLWSLPAEYGYLNLISVTKYFIYSPISAGKSFLIFLLYFIRLLSGVTAFEYFATPPSSFLVLTLDLFFTITLIFIFVLGFINLKKERNPLKIYFFWGFVSSLLLFFYVGGPKALSPGLSRQANYLIVPFSILLAILLHSFKKFRWSVPILFSILSLIIFWTQYFRAIEKTGGGFTHRTYATGPVEPKEALFNEILSREFPNKKITFLAEDWWVYWPIRFLANPFPEIEVVLLDSKITREEFEKRFREGAYALGFPGGKVSNSLQDHFNQQQVLLFQPPSYSRNQILSAWKLVQ